MPRIDVDMPESSWQKSGGRIGAYAATALLVVVTPIFLRWTVSPYPHGVWIMRTGFGSVRNTDPASR